MSIDLRKEWRMDLGTRRSKTEMISLTGRRVRLKGEEI